MHNKSFVSFFAIIFAIVCLYQLSFTWISDGVEKDAIAYSGGDEMKEKDTWTHKLPNPSITLVSKNTPTMSVSPEKLI